MTTNRHQPAAKAESPIEPTIKTGQAKSPNVCQNCEAVVSGAFCSTCGQQYMERLESSVVRRHVAEIFGLERGFLLTVFELFVKPRRFLKRYMSGATRPYTNPIAFFLIAMATAIIVENASNQFQVALDPELSPKWFLHGFVATMTVTTALAQGWLFRQPKLFFFQRLIMSSWITSGLIFFVTLIQAFEVFVIQVTWPEYKTLGDRPERVVMWFITLLFVGWHIRYFSAYYGSRFGTWMRSAATVTLSISLIFGFVIFAAVMIVLFDLLFGTAFGTFLFSDSDSPPT